MNGLAVDIETTGLNWTDRILTVAWAWRSGEQVRTRSVNLGIRDLFSELSGSSGLISIEQVREELSAAIEWADVVYLHNASFDLSYLYRDGILAPEALRNKLFDTLVMARATAARESASLADLCIDYGLSDVKWLEQKGRRGSLESVDSLGVLEYNEADAKNTLLLGEILLREALAIYDMSLIHREGSFSSLCAMMRVRGRKLHMPSVSREHSRITRRINELRESHLNAAGIHGPSDRTGIVRWLNLIGVGILSRTDKGNAVLDEEALLATKERVDGKNREMLDAILEARGLEKQLSTWINGMLERADERGYVHPNYTAGGTVSFRLSCSNPNVQAIPKEVKIWDAHLSADYSQAELRLAAMYAGENVLARLFEQPDADVHAETAKLMFGSVTGENRTLAKRCNFASIYGGGAGAISRATGVSEDKAGELIRSHARVYPALRRTYYNCMNAWKDRGYLTLISGKRLWASSDDINRRPYKAFNQLIQGSLAEVVKEAMLRLEEEGVQVISQVHDSIEMPYDTSVELVREVVDSVIPDDIRSRTTPHIRMLIDPKHHKPESEDSGHYEAK